jgi:hypothetical protein
MLLQRHNSTMPARTRWLALLMVLAFLALSITAARHLHASQETELHCAVCVAATNKIDSIAPVLDAAAPVYVLLYVASAVARHEAPAASPLPLPPACGPPRLS